MVYLLLLEESDIFEEKRQVTFVEPGEQVLNHSILQFCNHKKINMSRKLKLVSKTCIWSYEKRKNIIPFLIANSIRNLNWHSDKDDINFAVIT